MFAKHFDAHAFGPSFITEENFKLSVPQYITMTSCKFDINSFKPSLFSLADVECPPSIIKAVPKRQAEFLAGRSMAKLALEKTFPEIKQHPQIRIGADRCPIWPTDAVGSITHNGERAVCVVGRRADLQMIGVDIENILTSDMCKEVRDQIHTRYELEMLRCLGVSADIATTLIFSAKESLFKAAYPLVKRYFGFDCARIVAVNKDKRLLQIRVSESIHLKGNFPQYVSCHFLLQPDFVFTTIWTSFN